MADTWVKFEAALKAFADSAETERLFDIQARLSTFQLVGGLVQSGSMDLANATSDLAIDMGDVATGQFLFLEFAGDMTFKLSGTGNSALDLKQRVTGENALCVWMTEFTSLHVSCTTGARLNYCIVGV